MGRFEGSHLHTAIEPALDFLFARLLEEQLHRLFDHLFRLFDRPPLAGDAEFWTRGHEPILFTFDDGGQFRQLHGEEISSVPMNFEGLDRERFRSSGSSPDGSVVAGIADPGRASGGTCFRMSQTLCKLGWFNQSS